MTPQTITSGPPMTRTLDLESLTLHRGSHQSASGEMCVMEAVAFVAGEEWSDAPKCSSRVIAAFLRNVNDRVTDAQRQKLKRLIPKLVGTASTPDVERKRSLLAADYAYRIAVPGWLDLAGMTEQASMLRSLPEVTTSEQLAALVPKMRIVRDQAWDHRKKLAKDTGEKIGRAIGAEVEKKTGKTLDAIASAIAIASASASDIASDIAIASASDIASDIASAIASASAIARGEIRNAVYQAVRKAWREKIQATVEAQNDTHVDELVALAERMIEVRS